MSSLFTMPMRSYLTPPRLPSFTARSVEKSRRDFLAWLSVGAGAMAVGCVAPSSSSAGESGEEGEAPAAIDGEEAIEETESAQTVCQITSRDARGPYWEAGAPVRPTRIAELNEPGVRLGIMGRVFGPNCTTPLAGYALDVWQADSSGNYYTGNQTNYRLRGKIKTDSFGRYRFETILPGRYGDAAGIRPAHLHVSFLSPGGNVILTTQLYFEGDPFLGQADYCTRARTCNSADPRRALKLRNGFISNVAGKLSTFNAVLPRM